MGGMQVTEADFAAWQQNFGGGLAVDRGRLLGYGDDTEQQLQPPPGVDPADRSIYASGTTTVPDPIHQVDLAQSLELLTPDDKRMLAIEMLVVGVYDDINYMFDESGDINDEFFVRAVDNAADLAAQSAEYGLDTEFLDVLLRNSDRTPEELASLLAEKRAEAAAAAAGGGGGRIINYIDPVALVDAVKKASSSVTGRMANPGEQQAFVKMIHGLQASGATNISVGARAEAFARESAPVEAAAMDHGRAADLIMQAIGGGR